MIDKIGESKIKDMIEEEVADHMDDLDEKIRSIVEEYLSNCDFELKDGSAIKPWEKLRILSPDIERMLVCYGGVKIFDTRKIDGDFFPDGWGLSIETAPSNWDILYVYSDEDDAKDALKKIKTALIQNDALLEL